MKNIFTSAFLFLSVSAFAQDTKKDTAQLYDYGARIYDAHIGRFADVNPKAPQNSPYDFEEVIEDSTKKISFNDVLNKYSLQLTIPENFSEVPVKNNSAIKYQYALKHDSLDFEIRFLITGINKALDLPDDKRSLSLFTSIVLNASGEVLPNIPKIQEFGSGLAKVDYNADWVANSSFLSKSKFSEGFSYCSVIALRKNQIGEAYIFFLFNDKNQGAKLVSKTTTCLKFEK